MSVRASCLNYDFSPIVGKINESCRYPTILVEGKNDSIIYSQILGEKSIIIKNGKDNVIKELTEHPRKIKLRLLMLIMMKKKILIIYFIQIIMI